MNGVTNLLLKHVGKLDTKPQLMFLSESTPEQLTEEPHNEERTEQRIFEEIQRALVFLEWKQEIFQHGLLFFTYETVTDYSINNTFHGVDNSPRLMAQISEAASRVVGSKTKLMP